MLLLLLCVDVHFHIDAITPLNKLIILRYCICEYNALLDI